MREVNRTPRAKPGPRGGMSGHPPQRMKEWHRRVMLWMLLNPRKTLVDIAKDLECSANWLSLVVNTDMFQEELSRHREQMFGLSMSTTVEKLRAASDAVLTRVHTRLMNDRKPMSDKDLSDMVDKLLKYHLGTGRTPTQTAPGLVQNNYLVVEQDDLAQARRALRRVKERTAPLAASETDAGGRVLDVQLREDSSYS